MNRNGWNNEDLKIYEQLKREEHPAEALEDKVVHALRSNHLLRYHRPGRRLARYSAVAAIFIIVFGAGLLAGRMSGQQNNVPSFSDSTYLFLLMDGPHFQAPHGSDEIQKRVNEYRNWAIQLRQRGVVLSGVKLRDQADVINGSESEYKVRGYFVVEAKSREDAIAIANSCPHARYGGVIELRQVEPT